MSATAFATGSKAVATGIRDRLRPAARQQQLLTHMDDMTASVFDLLIYQSGWLLSVRWWALARAGGKFMRIRTFYDLPPKAALTGAGQPGGRAGV